MQVAVVDRVFPAVSDCEEDVIGKTEWTEHEVDNCFAQVIGDEAPEIFPKEKTRFRLLDDDDIVYFSGWLLNDDWAGVQQTVLSWATWYAGCTTIEVRVDGKWEREIG